MIARFSKAIAALLGTVTPAGVIALVHSLTGHELEPGVAGAIVAFVGIVAVALAPANTEAARPMVEQEMYDSSPVDGPVYGVEAWPETDSDVARAENEGLSSGRHTA